MAIKKTFLKQARDFIPFFADQELDYAVGTKDRNKQLFGASVTVAGSSAGAVAVTFSALFGVDRMEDAAYTIQLTADAGTAGGTDEEVTWSAKAVDGFTINGVVDGDVVDVLLFGQVEGQP